MLYAFADGYSHKDKKTEVFTGLYELTYGIHTSLAASQSKSLSLFTLTVLRVHRNVRRNQSRCLTYQ